MVMLLAGCATSRSIVDIPQAAATTAETAAPSNGKQVYIHAVSDKREFQVAPRSPDIPSMDASEEQSESLQHRAVARKRNTYGMALGDILLKEGDSVQMLIASSIRQAYVDKGYKVLDKPEQVTPDTYIVDADINKFWTWMNPGMWALTISSEISTDVSVKSGAQTTKSTVQVKAADQFQTGRDGNFIEVISSSLKLYTQELKLKLKE
jgi:hypothetical protein